MLDRLPEMLTDQTRTGTYGSWYNYYLCDFAGSIILPSMGSPELDALVDADPGQAEEHLRSTATAERCEP